MTQGADTHMTHSRVMALVEALSPTSTASDPSLALHSLESVEGAYKALERRYGTLQGEYNTIKGSLHTILGSHSFLQGTVSSLEEQVVPIKEQIGENQVILRGLVGSPHSRDVDNVATWQSRVVQVEAENAILIEELGELQAYALRLATKIDGWTQERGILPEPVARHM